jgi:hypothetical protein
MKHMTRQEYVASLRRYINILFKILSLYAEAATIGHGSRILQMISGTIFDNYMIQFILNWCRKSSGFSRGASIYRGVTR